MLLVSSPYEGATETMLRAEKTNKKKVYLVFGDKSDVSSAGENNNMNQNEKGDPYDDQDDKGWFTKTGRKRKIKKIIEEKRPYKRHRLLESHIKSEDGNTNNSNTGVPNHGLIISYSNSKSSPNSSSSPNKFLPNATGKNLLSSSGKNILSSASKEGLIKPVRGRPRLSDPKPKSNKMGRPRSMPMDGVNDSSLPPNKILSASGKYVLLLCFFIFISFMDLNRQEYIIRLTDGVISSFVLNLFVFPPIYHFACSCITFVISIYLDNIFISSPLKVWVGCKD